MTLEKFPIALKTDLRKVERELKHEVANLNLQLEAAQRVPVGKTFGTDFDSAFGMEIDTARTSCDTALTVGRTQITVRDASEFEANTEVTIYDDVNLERIKIASISGNVITLQSATTKAYKEGVNVARSMAVQNAFLKTMDFGVWGTYSLKEYSGSETFTLQSPLTTTAFNTVSANSTPRLHRIKDLWVSMIGISTARYVIAVRDNEPTKWFVLATLPTQAGNYGVVTLEVDDYNIIVCAKNGAYYYLYSYDTNGVLRDTWNTSDEQWSIDGGVTNTTDGPAEFKYVSSKKQFILSAFVGGNTKTTLSLFTISRFGEITYHKTIVQTTDTPTTLTTQGYRGHTSSIRIDDTDGSYIFARVVYSTADYESRVVIQKIDSSFSTITTILKYSNSTLLNNMNSATPMRSILVRYNRELALYEAFWHTNYSTSADLITWTTTIVGSTNGGVSGVCEMLDGDVWMVFGTNTGNSNNIFKLNYGNTVFTSVARVAIGAASISICQTPLGECDIPFFQVGNVIYGKGILGYGNEIKTNDIRFKTQPSKEIALWLQHDNRLNVSEAKFGALTMQKEIVQGETQFTAVSAINEHDEIRFTITRQSVDDDVKINKILGGIG